MLTIILLQLNGFFRKKTSWLLLIFLPLGFSYFIVGLFDGEAIGTQIPVVIVDEDQSHYSRMLVELLEEETYLDIRQKDLERGLLDLRENRVEGVYQIKEGFEDRIRRDQVPELTSYTSPLAQGGSAVGEIIISRSIRILSSARAANIVVSEAENTENVEDQDLLWTWAFQQSESYWEPEPLMTLSLEEATPLRGREGDLENPGVFGALDLLSGAHGLLIIYSAMFSLWIFYKQQQEEVSGLNRRQELILGKIPLFAGKFFGNFLFLSIHHSILLLSIYLFQGSSLRGTLTHQLWLLLMMQVVFIGLWTMLSKWGIGKKYLVVGLPIGILLTSMVSGALWTIELLPEVFHRLSLGVPQGIYMRGVEYSYLGETGAFYSTVLWGMGIGLTLLWIGFWKKGELQ